VAVRRRAVAARPSASSSPPGLKPISALVTGGSARPDASSTPMIFGNTYPVRNPTTPIPTTTSISGYTSAEPIRSRARPCASRNRASRPSVSESVPLASPTRATLT